MGQQKYFPMQADMPFPDHKKEFSVRIRIMPLMLMMIALLQEIVTAEQTIQIATINQPPLTGEGSPNQGFISELVTEAFLRVDYHVEFQYRPWARALKEAIDGNVDGLMNVYWAEDRAERLNYSDVVWRLKEEFFSLQENPILYTGKLSDLKQYSIGVLRGSLPAQEIEAAGVETETVATDIQNVMKLLAKRVDVVLLPREIFFNLLEQVDSQFDQSSIQILEPPYQIYDIYVAFSKQIPNYDQLTTDFNRGLALIKEDGSYEEILRKHHIVME